MKALHSPVVRIAPKPILRWAGGKHRLTATIRKLLPSSWNRYIEPMVGGAAVFLSIGPPSAVLSDINSELINFYEQLRDRPRPLITRMLELTASTSLYYEYRRSMPKSRLERALRFCYLNRLCWNGLYRVNQKGEFNVPIGSRRPAVLWSENNLSAVSEALQSAELRCSDFGRSLRTPKEGDLVFVDPPYPRGAEGVGFNRYSDKLFNVSEHERLARWLDRLDDRGVFFLVTLSNSEYLEAIYPDRFEKVQIESQSLIGPSASRGSVGEIIIRNFK